MMLRMNGLQTACELRAMMVRVPIILFTLFAMLSERKTRSRPGSALLFVNQTCRCSASELGFLRSLAEGRFPRL
jgi:hypothetical protein